MILVLLMLVAADASVTVVRCSIASDPQGRVFALQRSGEGNHPRWQMIMRSREAGASPVVLPLPDAKPVVRNREVALEYRTLNGGRDVKWTVDSAGGGTLDVYTNYELEVNIDTNLDPRVELMNTEGPISKLACEVEPKS